ncbi:MAG TPA: hypothetical protein VGF23_04675 [Gaiellaceae bacterium]|jgi:uncharacterized protein YjbJ (UPF0337 family)
MGFLDKLLGRGKQAAGDVTGDTALRKEGVHQERQAEAEDRAAAHEERAQEEREKAAEHGAARDQT